LKNKRKFSWTTKKLVESEIQIRKRVSFCSTLRWMSAVKYSVSNAFQLKKFSYCIRTDLKEIKVSLQAIWNTPNCSRRRKMKFSSGMGNVFQVRTNLQQIQLIVKSSSKRWGKRKEIQREEKKFSWKETPAGSCMKSIVTLKPTDWWNSAWNGLAFLLVEPEFKIWKQFV